MESLSEVGVIDQVKPNMVLIPGRMIRMGPDSYYLEKAPTYLVAILLVTKYEFCKFGETTRVVFKSPDLFSG